MEQSEKTELEFKKVVDICRDLFVRKLRDYGTSWRVMRASSVTDQIFIKARRIRSIQEKKNSKIAEGVESEFIGIINYSVIGLIQLENGSGTPMGEGKAIELYDYYIGKTTRLMTDKNHDYDEAWRYMRISSITDIILQKLLRTREIEDHDGKTEVSEGIDANYMDMINYSIFAMIKLLFYKETA